MSDFNLSEEWRAVVGFEGRYEVSSLGRVRSLDRPRRTNGNLRGRILKPSKGATGYLQVSLCIGTGRPTYHYVHRLVLEAFVGPRPAGTEACHNDSNNQNNTPANLRWDSHLENVRDTVRRGTHYSYFRARAS